ncbi:hypothetical protein FD13_GL000299 [Levilactobacillus senmaizukei DSM 21775 = NBRC 103853]|uniref:Cyanophage baseplate Pam3 plug gp18 domain-containing protein n=1 Tax=Levilactobacillus senmaizukei DSM 21775 = NBRC 103853 TaxID=1423803 RepID=A0A0R2DDR3_9LACO|nr:hypothetical protein [Levilactobacillus senmaizukei]KRN02159.1 hypothetical protein FD13_GL000299 [Levilactobacillus senmaizukei DSM 21775 = NBRC 103853]
MAIYDHFELDPDQLPYSYPIDIDDEEYLLGFSFNPVSGQIIAELSNDNGLNVSDPVILDHELFSYSQDPRCPMTGIVPRDESGQETEVNLGNINRTVFLTANDIERSDVDNGADTE